MREKDSVRKREKKEPMSRAEGLAVRRKLVLKFKKVSPTVSH